MDPDGTCCMSTQNERLPHLAPQFRTKEYVHSHHRGLAIDALHGIQETLLASPKGKGAEPLGQRPRHRRDPHLADLILPGSLLPPEASRCCGQGVWRRCGTRLFSRLGQWRAPPRALPPRANTSAEKLEKLLPLHSPQLEHQERVAVELLAQEVVNGRDVLAW